MQAARAQDTIPFLDVYAPGFRPDGAEVMAAREASWYARAPHGPAVLRYPQVSAVLADRRFRPMPADITLAMRGITSGPAFDWLKTTMLATDGAAHLRLSGLVRKAFTPRSVDRLRPIMRAETGELLDRFTGNGCCEFAADFADVYPASIICALLGVPAAQRDSFRGWAEDLGSLFDPEVAGHVHRADAAIEALYEATDAMIAARRGRPGPDLLSALIEAEEAGDRLSPQELRMMVTTLLSAGFDTTRNQLGLAMALFADHPDQWRLLAERPELAAQAVEEILRMAPTAAINGRVAREHVTIDGLDIPSGSYLHLIIAAANTDPRVFGPGGFDITARRPAPALTFGGGFHYCLGAALARAEMEEALPILARRMPALQVAGPVDWRPASAITGPRRLPLSFATPD